MLTLSFKVKDILLSIKDFFTSFFFTGWMNRVEAKKVPGLMDVENQLVWGYMFTSPLFFIGLSGGKGGHAFHNFCTGEIPYSVCREFVEICEITEKDNVYDLGCGKGKFLFYINLYTGARCIGVDLIKKYVEVASDIVERLGLKRIFFYDEDIIDVDLLTASVVLTHGTTFSTDLHTIIYDKIDRMKPGSRFISISVPYDHPNLEVIKEGKSLMNWGRASVYIYRVKNNSENTTPNP